MLAVWRSLKPLVTFVIAAGHFVCVTIASMVIGFIPEAKLGGVFYNTYVGVFSPFLLVPAAALGYAVARWLKLREAVWAWIPAVIWFGAGAYEVASGLHVGHHSTLTNLFDNLLAPTDKCAGSECVYELIYTTPLACSVAYSLVSWLTLRTHRAPAVRVETGELSDTRQHTPSNP
jgi:hypothetical protein